MINKRSGTLMNKLLFNLSVIALSAGLSSCNNSGSSGTGSSSPNPSAMAMTSAQMSNRTISKADDNFYVVNMGAGYDDSTDTVTSGQSCLVAAANPANMLISNPSAIMTFDQEQDFAALQNVLGVNISGQYAGGMFSTGIASQYAMNSQDTQYKTNLIYLYQYAGTSNFVQGSIGEGYKALTPVAAALAESHPTEFREMCGDDFIAQMNAGALLGVTLTLSFNSHMDQQKFAVNLKGRVGLVGIGAAIQQAATNSDVHVGLTMSAIQFGGEPQNLNNLFGSPESSGNYPYLDCGSVGGVQTNSCNAMIDSIIAYAETIESQLSNPDGSLNLNSLYYNSPVVANYDTLGVHIGAPNPESDVYAAMQDITSQYDKAAYDYNFITHYLLSLSGQLDSPTQENLEDAAYRLQKQMVNVYQNPVYDILDCYKGYVTENCVTIEQRVNNALIPYQLPAQESNEISYLETTSYSAKLYQYSGSSAQPQASSFVLSPQECIIAPTSSPLDAQYALNCNGVWLNILSSTGLTVNPAFNGLAVGGLSYMSESMVNGVVYQQPVTYQNSSLFVDPYYNNYYTGTDIQIMSGSIMINSKGDLDLTQWFENQA